MRFAVLGPVRAWRATEELDLRPRQLRLMLALLLVRAGRPVAVADFVALLWDEDPPARAVNIVHRHIGALRRIPGARPRAARARPVGGRAGRRLPPARGRGVLGCDAVPRAGRRGPAGRPGR